MFEETKIENRIDLEDFAKLILERAEQIECTGHTFFRLSKKQRKIYTYAELRRILIKETPFLVGIQYNKNYAVFYKYWDKNLKIVVNINDRKVKIVTFYFIEEWQIPNL